MVIKRITEYNLRIEKLRDINFVQLYILIFKKLVFKRKYRNSLKSRQYARE